VKTEDYGKGRRGFIVIDRARIWLLYYALLFSTVSYGGSMLVALYSRRPYDSVHGSKMCHTTKSYGTAVHILDLITKNYDGFF